MKFKWQKVIQKQKKNKLKWFNWKISPISNRRTMLSICPKIAWNNFKGNLCASEKPKSQSETFSQWCWNSSLSKSLFPSFFFCWSCAASWDSQFSFDRVSELGEGNNKQIAYIYAVCSGVVLILSQISRNNGMYESRILSSRLKAQMIFMIYTKISKISMFSVKSQEMGKIMNLLSNDFNVI